MNEICVSYLIINCLFYSLDFNRHIYSIIYTRIYILYNVVNKMNVKLKLPSLLVGSIKKILINLFTITYKYYIIYVQNKKRTMNNISDKL